MTSPIQKENYRTSEIVSLRQNPAQLERFVAYFSCHWGNAAVYRDCMAAGLDSNSPLPQWYLLENFTRGIIGCAGLITNDFISRMDLWPWLCALYIDEPYRGNALGSVLIKHVRSEAFLLGFPSLYLCTDHVGYYEKYGFEHIANGIHPWGKSSRIYRCKTDD